MLEFELFSLYISNLQGFKYIYPHYLVNAYAILQNATYDGKVVEYSSSSLEAFKKAFKYVFIFDELEYNTWSNKDWFESLPIKPLDWKVPITNNILHNAILSKMLCDVD